MKMRNFIKEIYSKVSRSNNLLTFKEQERFLLSLPEPKDDFDRSYFQYKCQMFKKGKKIWLIMNLASILIIPLFLIYAINKTIYRNIKNINKIDTEDKVIFIVSKYRDDLLPKEITMEIDDVVISTKNVVNISKKDISFIKKLIVMYPTSWYFLLKNIIKISHFSGQIIEHQPDKIICAYEYSFTSSILTQYCEINGVELVNVMHGEKLYDLDNTFFRFHKFYIWDSYYEELFKLLRAGENHYLIGTPPAISLKSVSLTEEIYDYKYYLGVESDDQLKKIYTIMKMLTDKGHKVSVRIHPNYFNKKNVETIFKDIEIENPISVEISESIESTRNIISQYSTVLYQGYILNKSVVIDDYSDVEMYSNLKELKYIMLNKPHKLISEIIEL